MDLQALVQEHKVFLRNAGIGFAIYLVLMYFGQSMGANASDLALKNDNSIRSLSQREKQLKGVEGQEKGRTESLTAIEPRVFQKLLWNLSSEYKIDEKSQNKFLDFTKLRRNATYAIRKAAQQRAELIPKDFGFLSNKDNEALIDEHLFRLDLTAAVCEAIFTKGKSAKILNVSQQSSEYSKLPFSTSLGDYLQAIPTSFSFQVDPQTLPSILAEVQSNGRFAQLLKFEQYQISATSDVVKVDLKLAALFVAKKIIADKSKPNPVNNGGRPVKPNRGLRKFGRPR